MVVVHIAASTIQRQDELVRHKCLSNFCSGGLGEHYVRRRRVRDVIIRSGIHSVGTRIPAPAGSRVVVVHIAASTIQRQDELARHKCLSDFCSGGLGEHYVRRRSVRDVIIDYTVRVLNRRYCDSLSYLCEEAAGWSGG